MIARRVANKSANSTFCVPEFSQVFSEGFLSTRSQFVPHFSGCSLDVLFVGCRDLEMPENLRRTGVLLHVASAFAGTIASGWSGPRDVLLRGDSDEIHKPRQGLRTNLTHCVRRQWAMMVR